MSRDADQVPEIEQLEQLVRLFPHIVQLHVNLQPLSRSINVGEARFSVQAERENPAGDADHRLGGFERGSVGIAVLLKKFRRRCRPIEFVRIGIVPARLNLGKLFLALKELIDWFER